MLTVAASQERDETARFRGRAKQLARALKFVPFHPLPLCSLPLRSGEVANLQPCFGGVCLNGPFERDAPRLTDRPELHRHWQPTGKQPGKYLHPLSDKDSAKQVIAASDSCPPAH